MQPEDALTTQSTEQPQYDYVGEEVQIGAGRFGMKPLAQHGAILIGNGQLILLGTQGQVIAEAPLAECSATKGPWFVFGQGAWLTVRGIRYFVSIGHGKTQFGAINTSPALSVYDTRKGTKEFLEAFEKLS